MRCRRAGLPKGYGEGVFKRAYRGRYMGGRRIGSARADALVTLHAVPVRLIPGSKGKRGASSDHHFLSPLWGLRVGDPRPRACALGCILAPLRSWSDRSVRPTRAWAARAARPVAKVRAKNRDPRAPSTSRELPLACPSSFAGSGLQPCGLRHRHAF
jgi:hypothetical protein